MRRTGVSRRQVILAIGGFLVAMFAAGKLLLVLNALRQGLPAPEAFSAALAPASMGTPGWIALAIAIGFLITRLLGLPILRTADAVAPTGGLLIFGTRIGCFLEGCCYGMPSSVPWAVTFPSGSHAYRWQLNHDLIWFGTASSLPVHPLQLYFALFGFLLFVGLAAYSTHKRYDGQVLLLFGVAYLWGAWLLEPLRAQPRDLAPHLLLLAALVMTALAVAVAWWRRARAAKPQLRSTEPCVERRTTR